MRRSRSPLIALGAAVAELVLVAAAGNQWVVDHLVRHAPAGELPRNHGLKAALTAFPWRFTSESHQSKIWLGGIVAAVGMVIVVYLLVLAFVASMRPPRGFVAVFLGTWGLVLGITQIAAIGRALIAYNDLFPSGHDPARLGRFWYSVFEGPTAATVLFGGVSGLIVALVTAIIAAATNASATESEEELDTFTPLRPGESLAPAWQPAETPPAWPPAESPTRADAGWTPSESDSESTVVRPRETTASWPMPESANESTLIRPPSEPASEPSEPANSDRENPPSSSPPDAPTRSWSSQTTTASRWRSGPNATGDGSGSPSADVPRNQPPRF